VPPLPPAVPNPRRKVDEFEVVVRLQPWGPTAQIRVTPATPISDLKLDALRQLIMEPAEPDEFELRFGNWPLDERGHVADEGLYDLAFVTLGLPEENQPREGTKAGSDPGRDLVTR
jgi:hypothetical protein